MKLFANPLEIRVFVRQQLAQQWCQQPVVFLHRLDDAAGRQVQFGQSAAVVLHLFDELQRRLTARQNSRRRSWSERCERSADLRFELLGLELPVLEPCQETPVQSFDVRQKKNGQPLQVDTKLVAQNICGIGEFRGYFR